MRLLTGIVVLIVLLSLQSCDPTQCFIVINKSRYPATVEIIHHPDAKYFNIDSARHTEYDTLNISLAPDSIYQCNYGVPAWPGQHGMAHFADSITRIELRTLFDTKVYSDTFQIRNLIRHSLKGQVESTIEIRIE
jgi:hypothetical protein